VIASLVIRCVAVAAVDAVPGRIRFVGRVQIGGTSEGEFSQWRIARALIDEQDPGRSEVVVEIELNSLVTGISRRDRHIKSADFLDVERFPIARATLTRARLVSESAFVVTVELDLHGQLKRFPMSFQIADRARRAVTGEVTPRRSDFPIGTPRGGIFRVDDEVRVLIEAIVPPAMPTQRSADEHDGAIPSRTNRAGARQP
jgi:polyisoprenoid-binding protein YceI